MQLHANRSNDDRLIQQSYSQLLQAKEKLREALQRGQSVVEKLWSYNTRSWATSVHAADIDGDGDIEVLIGLRDGRVCALTKRKALKWMTSTLDGGEGIETVVGLTRWGDEEKSKGVYVIAGSRNGTIFGLDYKGMVICDYKVGAGIQHIYVDPLHPEVLIVGGDDCCIHILNSQTLRPVGSKLLTKGGIRSVFSYDIDEDGDNEIFAASNDHTIYVLGSNGECRATISTWDYKIYALFVAPLDNGEMTLLAGTSDKKLMAWRLQLQERDDRLLSFQEKRLPLLDEEGFGSRIRTICIADVNKDNYPEILVGTEDKSLSILDRSGKMLWKHDLEQFVSAIFALDIDFDGITEVLVGLEDNNIQLLRIELDKKNDNRYEDILAGYRNFSQKESQLLSYLVTPQRQNPHYRHMEWNWVELFIAQRKYEEALSLLLRLRRQGFQHLWSEATPINGSIRSIDSGNHSRDIESEITLGTENGYLEVLDIKPSVGYKVVSEKLHKGIYKLEVLTNIEGFDHILVGFDDRRLSILDYEGKLRKKFSIDGKEDIVSTFYVYKQYNDRKLDACSKLLVALIDGRVCICDSSLSQQITIFETGQEIHMLCSNNYDNDVIIVSTAAYHIYAYEREGKCIWSYQNIRGRIRALFIRDIDGDGNSEVIAGSEDCSVYVLNHQGLLKWRYLMPHRVLTVEVGDIDNHDDIEILVGCENGYVYALDCEGDLLWMYEASDRITAIHAQELHQHGNYPDKKVEIALGTDRKIELLQMLDPQEIIQKIDFCWKEWQELLSFHDRRKFILDNARHKNRDIHVLVIAKLAGSRGPDYTEHIDDDLQLIEEVLSDKSLEVRQELARIAINLERSHGDHPRCMQLVRNIFQELSLDPRVEVKLTLVDRLPSLKDTSLCFEYLERLTYNEDVWVRRAVIRKLDMLVENDPDRVFALLLKMAKAVKYDQDEVLSDDERNWIYQEVGRSFAHYFSVHQETLFRCIQALVTQRSSLQVIQQISYSSSSSSNIELQDLFNTLTGIMRLWNEGDEDRRNAKLEDLLDVAIKALYEVSCHDVMHSKGMLQVYEEFRQLFRVRTIDEIEQYQWIGEIDLIERIMFTSPVLSVFAGLVKVIDNVRRYRKRQIMGERLAALIQAHDNLKNLRSQIESTELECVQGEERERTQWQLTYPIEDHIFLYILNRWMDIVFKEIKRVRGKAKLRFELKRDDAWFEELVVVSLQITNEGRCPSEDVSIYLEESTEFDIEDTGNAIIDEISTNCPARIEFTIRPFVPCPRLVFHIDYTDAEGSKTFTFADMLALQVHQSQFKPIPDKYRVGMPLKLGEQDRKLFFGRRKDILLLQEKLTDNDTNSVVVLSGQRRSGKTSLLYQLVGQIEECSQHLPILVDLQGLALLEGVSPLLREVAQLIFEKIKYDIPALTLSVEGFSKNPTIAFDNFLKDVLSQLAPRKIILLIDEFEMLQENMNQGRLSPLFLKYLRSLVQHQHGISFLLAGSPKIQHLTEWYWSAFFNIAYTHALSKLEKDEAEELITTPVREYLKYDALALEKLHQLTDDQPYLVHLISATLVKHCNEKRKNYVTVNDVNVVCEELVNEHGNHFIWIWNQLHDAPTARLILSILAQSGEGEFVSPGGIYTELEALGYHFEKNELLEGLNSLVEEEFVEEVPVDEVADGLHYRIPIGLTRAWLRTIKPPTPVESKVLHDSNHAEI